MSVTSRNCRMKSCCLWSFVRSLKGNFV